MLDLDQDLILFHISVHIVAVVVVLLLFLFLGATTSSKRPKAPRFKSDRDEIWQKCMFFK